MTSMKNIRSQCCSDSTELECDKVGEKVTGKRPIRSQLHNQIPNVDVQPARCGLLINFYILNWTIWFIQLAYQTHLCKVIWHFRVAYCNSTPTVFLKEATSSIHRLCGSDITKMKTVVDLNIGCDSGQPYRPVSRTCGLMNIGLHKFCRYGLKALSSSKRAS